MADIVSDGMVKVGWVTTLSSLTSPTATQITAGVDLESFLTPDGLGIELGDEAVDTSALNSTFSTEKAGRGTVSIELTFKDQGAADPASEVKPEIWANWDEFLANAKKLGEAAGTMDLASAESIGAGMGAR